MIYLCKACRHFEAAGNRGIHLCHGCTRILRDNLNKPSVGVARVVEARHYGEACEVCGEYRDRKILDHPEWGRICEVDVREACEFYEL